MRTSELLERDRPSQGAYVSTLRVLLRLTNALLALLGLAMLGYAVYMFLKFNNTDFPSFGAAVDGDPSPAPTPTPVPPPTLPPPPPPPSHKLSFPWFIFAFGGVGLFTCITAASGLAGVSWNSRALLGVYSVLLVVMLLAQAVVAAALFTDKSWRKYLPPDETGEFKRIERFVKSKLDVCRWVGLAVLVVQLLSLALAYALSTAQQRLLEVSDDEEDEVWGRRRPLLSSEPASPMERGDARTDAWSARMRDKYGLDTSRYTYNPEARTTSSGSELPARPQSAAAGRRCAIM
ncbi:Tobamovirus multiplication protein 2A [Coccomyxa sp. Obi]|nr:Tobamovirus multiplication protein 2A [Coccomyxa sp. Obi]